MQRHACNSATSGWPEQSVGSGGGGGPQQYACIAGSIPAFSSRSSGAMAPVRLWLGGLPEGCTAEELAARFTPFGAVTACSLAAPKLYGQDTPFERHFGHVELEPKDEASLRRAISAYNGCKWRGAVLRCAIARQHFAERLAAERAGGAGASGDEAEVRTQGLLPGILAVTLKYL